jgi:arylsulfatase A-like enzyme
MRITIRPLIVAIWTVVFFIGCKEQKTDKDTMEVSDHTPNILVIVTDDMGWFDLGCYGNDFIETPNLDRLAAQGIRFTDGYAAAPLCSPSRASLITGLHPVTVNITEHIHGNRPVGSDKKLSTPPIAQQLDLKYTTTAEALKAKDYVTAHIGKWHLGGGEFLPEHQGFDVNIAGAWNGLPSSFFYPFFPMGEKPEIQNTSEEGDYLTDVLTEKAIQFIEKQRDTIFFLSLNYYSPHVPIEGKEELVEKYRQKRGEANDSVLPDIHYAAMIESIDQNVGRIMAQLDSLDLAENTLVVFTSDNGGLSVEEVPAFAQHTPPTDNGQLRAGTGNLYEGGIREPFIVRWPGSISPGQTDATPVIAQDLFATIMEVTDVTNDPVYGKSLLPIFNGNERSGPTKLTERGLLWHMPHYSPQHGKPSSAYRKGDWKIVRFYEDDRYELYNLTQDLRETRELSKENPERLKEMKRKMNQALNELGAEFPEPNPDYVGD